MTTKALKHKFASAISDGADATQVRPSNWNDDHSFFLGVNAQTGTTYTFVDGDQLCSVTFSNSSAVAVTLPQAGASSTFLSGWVTFVRNIGAGEVTITPTTSTINGSATLVLAEGQFAIIISDGTNYTALAGLGRIFAVPEISVASSGTTDIGAASSPRVVVTGTTTITSLGTHVDRVRFVRFSGALTLTHNGTSLILPGGTSILTAAGDTAIFESDTSGNWRCMSYMLASGYSLNARGGYLNKFRNPGQLVQQRGSSVTVSTSGGYTTDGWIVKPTGASISVSPAGALTGAVSPNSLQLNGATSVTDVLVKQRLESIDAGFLASQTVTFQAKVSNSTGGSVTPTLIAKHANASDNWSGSTAESADGSSVQACANGVVTQVAYTFAVSSSGVNGLEIGLDFGNNFSSGAKQLYITDLDIRVTPSVPTGLNSSPPAPEIPRYSAEFCYSQRYYQVKAPDGAGYQGNSSTAEFWVNHLGMRATPSVSVTGAVTVASGASTFTQSSGAISANTSNANGGSYGMGNFTSLPSNAIAWFDATNYIQFSAEL